MVVLPEPVPPEIRMFSRQRAATIRSCAISGLIAPNWHNFAKSMLCFLNLRMEIDVPSIAIGGITILTRLPSRRRASHKGLDSSTRRPTRLAIRFAIPTNWGSSIKVTLDFSTKPLRSIKIASGPLIMISEIVSSSMSLCKGPRPTSSSANALTNSLRSELETAALSLSINKLIALSSSSSSCERAISAIADGSKASKI